MKFSIKTQSAIEELILADMSDHLASEQLQADEVEQALRSQLQEIGRRSFGQLLSRMAAEEAKKGAHCQCGGLGRPIANREAQVLSFFGWTAYRRPYCKCQACGTNWVPFDQQQGLRPGRATALMSSLLGLAGVTVAFEEARQQIEVFLQVSVSANTIRRETQLMGAKQAELEQTWQAASQDIANLQGRKRKGTGPARLYGSIDGAFVPVETAWKEAKTVAWYQAGAAYGHPDLKAQQIAYYTSLEKADTFGELLWATGVQHQADQAQELVFVCDGAAWIWNLVQLHFPQAVQIVDWYHACQYLYPLAEALPQNAAEQQSWLTEMKDLLWQGEIEMILQAVRSLVRQLGPPAERLLSYYTNNQARMRYADFRGQGYFIGSGTVESGCKQIVTMRLKRSGARWTKLGASLTAKARTVWLNGKWPQFAHLPCAA